MLVFEKIRCIFAAMKKTVVIPVAVHGCCRAYDMAVPIAFGSVDGNWLQTGSL